MPLVHLTATNLRALPALGGKITEWRDGCPVECATSGEACRRAVMPGLMLRVSPPTRRYPRGARVWYLVYKRHGRNVPYRLGWLEHLTLSKARDAAQDLRSRVNLGCDPHSERIERRRRAQLTVAELCHLYLDQEGPRALAERTLSEWRRVVKRDIEAKPIGGRPAAETLRGEILEWSEALQEASRDGAAHAFAVLRRVYSWAVGNDKLAGSPFVGLTPPARPRRSKRVLTTRELRAMVLALRDLDDGETSYPDAVRLLVYTLGRASMVTGMTRSELEELDSTMPRWVISPRRGLKRRRGGAEHVVPLVAAAVDVIRRRLQAIGAGQHLFPTAVDPKGRARKHATTSITSGFMDRLRLATSVRYAADELGLALDVADPREAQEARHKAEIAVARGAEAIAKERELEKDEVAPRPRWTPHHLRTAAATHMREDLDVDPEVISLLLAHTRPTRKGNVPEVTDVYLRAELLGQRRAALVAWAAWLDRLGQDLAAASQGAKVVPMTSSSRA